MRYASVLALLVFSIFPAPAFSQQTMKMGDKDWVTLEKLLDDVNNQWLCAGKYYKAKRQDCVDFRAKYWSDQFFEVGQTGKTQTKAEMVASQTAAAAKSPDVVPGTGPNPQEFKLMSVYGDIALATDHTVFKTADAGGKVSVTAEAHVLRMFVRENGKWRPAGAVLIPIEKK
jgi:Domain of unknown function (DUF4440)